MTSLAEALQQLEEDQSTSVKKIREMIECFVSERDWHQFHAPKNISMALAVEAAELMEHFQWLSVEASRDIANDLEKKEAVAEELADVLCYGLALANELNIDVAQAMKAKMIKNVKKYPAEIYKGRYEKENVSKT